MSRPCGRGARPVSIHVDIYAQHPGGAIMLISSHLPFLPAGRALRRHRAALQHEIAAEAAAHLLPGLLSLPLGAAPLPDLAAVLAAPRSIGLYGAAASGRSLALVQLAHSWAESNSAAAVLYLTLADADAPNLTPRAVVAGALHRAGLPAVIAEGGRPAVLLLDDWELLPADRRAVWRAYLAAGAQTWQALRAVVALPAGEAWPELEAGRLEPPDAERAAAWLAHLLPGHDIAPLVAALRREPLARLLTNLADLALLALIYPLAGLPASRAELYEQAYALARPMVDETPRVGRAVLRHYRLARGLAGGSDLDTLAALSPLERAAVAPLAASLLDDPAPVLAPLWGDGEPDAADLRALAACTREWPGRAPRWDLRLVERLAAHSASPEERALLAELAPALPALLAAAANTDQPRALAAFAAADAALPDAPRPWLTLVDDVAAPAALRWAAADGLAARPPAPAELAVLPGTDSTALAARCYIATISREARRLLATPAMGAAFAALLASPEAGERRAAAARTIVADGELPEELRAAALAAAGDRELLEHSAVGDSARMRQAALATLSGAAPEEALAVIARALEHNTGATARREALDATARLELPAATGLLARVAIDGAQALDTRLHAVDLLAGRGRGGQAVLLRLLVATALPATLRAAAAGHLGRLGVGEALPALRNALEASEPTLRRAAARALGALGTRAGLGEQSAAALLTGLRRVGVDAGLGASIARALGHTGAALAVPTLTGLLGPELEGAMRAAWQRRAPELATLPATAWPDLDLPADARFALIEALADGGTMADPPTRLAELAARQAAVLAAAAAAALGDLACANSGLREAALAALRRGLADPARIDVVRAALDALAVAGDPAVELAAILDAPGYGPSLRWLAVEHLGRSGPARALLLRRLENGIDDSFLQSAAAQLLGAYGQTEALPALRRIARAADSDPQLRRAAVAALGQLGTPEAAAALAAIAADPVTPAGLRAAAAAALPADPGPEARAALHHAARSMRQQTEVAVALARALARTGDYDALPALVRSAQGDHGADAVASIEAITALGDPTVAPMLVRISQSPTATAGVRLAAVIALLRLAGDEHLPLLREYLGAASPPLRLQAYGALAALRPDDPRLGEPLADPAAPMALRLQALRQIAGRDADDPVLGLILTNADEEPQLRLASATALAAATTPRAVAALVAVPAPPPPGERAAPPVLRRRCIATLSALARGAGAAAEVAREGLIVMAADTAQPPAHRYWAAEELLRC